LTAIYIFIDIYLKINLVILIFATTDLFTDPRLLYFHEEIKN